MNRRTVMLLLLLLLFCPSLHAGESSVSISYEMYMLRNENGSVNAIYFTGLDGRPLSNGSYYAIDMEKTLSDIQFMIAVNNNLTSSANQPALSLTFETFKRTDLTNDSFRGGYVAAVWRYKPVTLSCQTDEEGTTVDWIFQAQPSTSDQPIDLPDGISPGTLNTTWDQAGHVEGNNRGTNSSFTLTWDMDRTEHPLGESRIWYYGIGLQFSGNTEFGDTDYKDSYPPGGRFAATLTLTVSGL